MAVKAGRSIGSTVLFAAGLVCIYVGERIVGSGAWRGVLAAAGSLAVAGACAWRILRRARSQGDARKAEGLLLALQGAGVLALVLYAAQSDLPALWDAKALSASSPKLATALAALWPALVALAMLPMVLVEMGYAAMARAPVVEIGRLREALYSGVGLAAALVLVFAGLYAFNQRDVKWDLSYFRTARPGTSTRGLVASFDQPVDVYLFFPPANDVREEVRGYLDDLARESPQLRVHDLDQAVDPVKARELGVSANGAVVVTRGARKEVLQLGVRLESARGQLRSLDKDMQKRLLMVSRSNRIVYTVIGHGERGEMSSQEPGRAGLNALKEMLRSQNNEVRQLGAAEGLASEVPADAACVLVIGPKKPYLPEELQSLRRYVDRGGRLLIALDPDAGLGFEELLSPLGLKLVVTPLANDRVFLARSHRPLDRAYLLTASYSSHPSVGTLGRLGSQAPMVLILAGSYDSLPDKPGGVSVSYTVHAHGATWADANQNFENDPGEVRKPYELAAAVTFRPSAGAKPEQEGRVVAIADSDALADGVVENAGNALFALDGMRWLMGDDSLAGEISTEADAPVLHTRKQDVAWFYVSIFAVPAAILGAGWFATRRRRAKAGAQEEKR